ncbi:MAG TPA: hypothetical protein VKM55_16280 [Candidatus Lokiarchaeia archaeon]|nr:hypothetical protein [Candidatus Lokiarchaeia archaeon]
MIMLVPRIQDRYSSYPPSETMEIISPGVSSRKPWRKTMQAWTWMTRGRLT